MKIRRWRNALCSVCMAVLLVGCGGTGDDGVQIVEEENITDLVPAEEDAKTAEESDSGTSEEAELPEAGTETAPLESGSAESGEKVPAVVNIEEEKQEYTEGEIVIMTTDYDHVTVTVEGNEAATAAVMAEFEKREQSFEESLAEVLEWAKQDSLVTDSGMSYSEECGYAVKRNDGRILSFSVFSGGFEGGAHGYYMEYGLNFDAETGAVLTIADIAQDEAAFQEICVREMLRQCEDLRAQGILFEEEMLDYSGGLQGILENKMEGEEWYFTEEGVCFISNIYEIAPYAAGHFQFDIPYEMINEVLKEEYRG